MKTERLITPPEKELQRKKFEQDQDLFNEFNGDFDIYWAWFEADRAGCIKTLGGQCSKYSIPAASAAPNKPKTETASQRKGASVEKLF